MNAPSRWIKFAGNAVAAFSAIFLFGPFSTASAQYAPPNATATFQGNQNGDSFGGRILSLGDITGDRVNEIIVMAPNYIGPAFGPVTTYLDVINPRNGARLYSITEHSSLDIHQTSLAVVPDLNGDAFPDLAVGVLNHSFVTFNPPRIEFHDGRTGTLLSNIPTIFGPTPSATGGTGGWGSVIGYVGKDPATQNDLLAIVMPYAAPTSGAVIIRDIQANQVFRITALTGNLRPSPDSTITTCDVNGDGTKELVYRVFDLTLSQPPKIIAEVPLSGTTVWTWDGAAVPNASSWFGEQLVCGGDLTADGKEDLVTSDSISSGPLRFGVVYIFDGNSHRIYRQWNGNNRHSRFGAGLAVGDVVGDAKPELLVGADSAFNPPGSRFNNDGRAYLFSIDYGFLWQTYALPASLANGRSAAFGTSLLSMGDIDGDTRADIAVGVPESRSFYSNSTPGPGQVKVFPWINTQNYTCPTPMLPIEQVGYAPNPSQLPRLLSCGSLARGQSASLQVQNAPPNANGILLVSLHEAMQAVPDPRNPFGIPLGAIVPDLVNSSFTSSIRSDAQGNWSMTVPGGLGRVPVYVQVFFLDPLSPVGFIFSDGGQLQFHL